MALPNVNFRLTSPVIGLDLRDFPVGNLGGAEMPADVLPSTAKALIDGEWMKINGSYEIERAVTVGASITAPAYPLYLQKGRNEPHAMGKMPVIFLGTYEVDTKAYETDGTPTTTYAAGTALTVTGAKVVGDAVTARSVLAVAASGDYIVGFVTKAPSADGEFMRVHCGQFGLKP